MRSITVAWDGTKYMTYFVQDGSNRWQVESYLIEPLEVMVDWIEKGILPKYSYRWFMPVKNQAEYKRNQYAQRIARGVCYRCKKPVMDINPRTRIEYTRCKEHREMKNDNRTDA